MKRFEVGARVMEPTYGLGSVIAVEDAYTRVQFDEHGVKKFLTSMSKLEPSDEPAPAGARGVKTRKKRVTKKAAVAAAPACRRTGAPATLRPCGSSTWPRMSSAPATDGISQASNAARQAGLNRSRGRIDQSW